MAGIISLEYANGCMDRAVPVSVLFRLHMKNITHGNVRLAASLHLPAPMECSIAYLQVQGQLEIPIHALLHAIPDTYCKMALAILLVIVQTVQQAHTHPAPALQHA